MKEAKLGDLCGVVIPALLHKAGITLEEAQEGGDRWITY